MTQTTALERFMAKVDKSGDCWLWIAAVDGGGYGLFKTAGVLRRAHRWAYEEFVGPIPAGLDIDHLCHSRDVAACVASGTCAHKRCVNPAHLEPVTRRENVMRGATSVIRITHCLRGHEYTPENTYRDNRGSRSCRTCSINKARRQVRQRPAS